MILQWRSTDPSPAQDLVHRFVVPFQAVAARCQAVGCGARSVTTQKPGRIVEISDFASYFPYIYIYIYMLLLLLLLYYITHIHIYMYSLCIYIYRVYVYIYIYYICIY